MSTNAISDILFELTEALNKLSSQSSFDITRDEMLTMDEVCNRLKIHRNTLTGWIKKGAFPEPLNIAGQQRWSTSLINARIYEDNPQLREREYLMAEARRISEKTGAAA